MTSFVYKLFCPEDQENFYIGSTNRNLRKRVNEHRYDVRTKRWSKKKVNFFCDKVDTMECEIIGTYFNINKDELLRHERYYVENLKPTLNSCCPVRDKGEYKRLYYLKNKEKICEKRKKMIECDICKKNITIRNLSRHKKTNYCKNYTESE
jgi:Uri superfamily endonuclease